MSEKNEMCNDCPHYRLLCTGTEARIYSGCIWKTASAESLEAFLQTERACIEAARKGKGEA